MQTEKIQKLYSEFIYKRTYSRWIEEESRRETWNETVNRYAKFFAPKVPIGLKDTFNQAMNQIATKDVMPSMRCLWSAGPALEDNHFAAYNCAFIAIEDQKDFGEMLYILMHGTGVGFSVERQFIVKLPEVPQIENSDYTFQIPDSKLGWKQAIDVCIENLYLGKHINFDYSLLRPKGARLKTFGGRSSGPAPLKQLLEFIQKVFKRAQGNKLNSLEVHDICCMIASCVVVGGVRRSACISFSNLSDQRMRHAKDGQFYIENHQRSLANNSVAYTEKPDSAMFMEEWLNLMRSGSGERGLFNTKAARKKADQLGRRAGEVRANPCGEAILFTKELCNLSEVIVKPSDTIEGIKKKIESAVLIGCLQATLTDFQNVSEQWKINCEAERLLGVSLTGVCDNTLFKKVNTTTELLLTSLREYAHDCANEYSQILGISVPKQITLTKPSGTVSQLCNTASGIHPRYSDYYIRRVRVNAKDPMAKLLISKGITSNYEVGQTKEEHTTLVFDFPIKSPRGSLLRDHFTAIEQLEYWKMFNAAWCDGNPSVTIYIKEDEWVEVGAWVYKNWDSICGLSFLNYDGGNYQLAPYEEITKEQYYSLCKDWKQIDINFDSELILFESEDNTQGAKELACIGGSCEI